MPAIGLDLDNTLIDYSASYPRIAEQLGLPAGLTSREDIRTLLRKDDNDWAWQEFQSLLYTDGLQFATLAPGAGEFLDECVHQRIDVYVVSHKTAVGPPRFGSRDLLSPAWTWIEGNTALCRAVPHDRISFHSTMAAKVLCIGSLNLTLYLDDLEAVLNHPDWPVGVRPVLYRVEGSDQVLGGVANFDNLTSWLRSGSIELHA